MSCDRERKGLGRMLRATAVVGLAGAAWLVPSGGHCEPPKSRTAAGAQAPPTQPAAAKPSDPQPGKAGSRPVAIVNGAEITADELAAECLSRHGAESLEAIVNRRLIEQACARSGISVGKADIDAEIDALCRRFSVPRDKWLELIRQERGVTEKQYADDIVWPMLALRRLARHDIEPGDAEIQEAYEKQFGPAVKARIIVLRTREEAEQIRTQAVAAPDEFPALARQHSVDVGSASANGWVQPIRLHSGEPQFDRAAFALRPGDISEVVQVADQFIVIKCEGQLPAAGVPLADARPRLAEELRERKSRQASTEFFRRLQDGATIENVMNAADKASAQPGVAARVNGDAIPVERVREVCLERHGLEVLEILITRRLIGQALARERQTVSQADLDAEVARAAESMGFRGADGRPDVAAWLERVSRDAKIPLRHYMEDVVWPSVALKKLVGSVPVTREDLDRAFTATFGPRAKCRVIVLDNQRRAQEVWQMARRNPTAETIATLAESYSVDPTTKALRGEVPPIQRFSGQPALEREAFALKPGELSGVVQVADRFMVVFCEGYTPAAEVGFEEVKGELHADIFEKKQRIEMARHFTQLRDSAAIDNLLAGTSQSPVKTAADPPAKRAPMQADLDELAKPRTGSRSATAATPAPTPGGVVPASHEAVLPARPATRR